MATVLLMCCKMILSGLRKVQRRSSHFMTKIRTGTLPLCASNCASLLLPRDLLAVLILRGASFSCRVHVRLFCSLIFFASFSACIISLVPLCLHPLSTSLHALSPSLLGHVIISPCGSTAALRANLYIFGLILLDLTGTSTKRKCNS